MTSPAVIAAPAHARGRYWWEGPKAWLAAIPPVIAGYAWLHWDGGFLNGEASAPFWMAANLPAVYAAATGVLFIFGPVLALRSMADPGSHVPWYRNAWHLLIASILSAVVLANLTVALIFWNVEHVEAIRYNGNVYHLALLGSEPGKHFAVFQCDSLDFWCQRVYYSASQYDPRTSFSFDPVTGRPGVNICVKYVDELACKMTFVLPNR